MIKRCRLLDKARMFVGWEDTRTRCKTRSDDCIGHSCRNGATCVDGRRTYTCRCQPGYTGSLRNAASESYLQNSLQKWQLH